MFPVEIRQLSRRFGSRLALDDVTLEVPTGTVFGMVGENGAGKTTLLKHVLGLLKAQSGTLRVFGHDPVSHPVDVLFALDYAGSRDQGQRKAAPEPNFRSDFNRHWKIGHSAAAGRLGAACDSRRRPR